MNRPLQPAALACLFLLVQACSVSPTRLCAQEILDTLEVRIIDGFHEDIIEHIQADSSGVLVLGTTTSPFEQFTASGKKWFLCSYDDSLNQQWFNVGVFQSETTSEWPYPPPSGIDLRGVMRGAMDGELPTAWILSNHLPAAQDGEALSGGWRARMDRFSSEGEVVSLDLEGLASLSGWSEAACLVQPDTLSSGPEEPLAWVVGTHFDWPYGVGQLFWAACDGAGFYDEQLVSAFDLAPFSGFADQGLRAVDAALYDDTLYIAAALEGEFDRAVVCVAARQNPGGISEDHTFEPLSIYAFELDSLTPAAIDAGPLGVALSMTRERPDGTADLTFAMLKKGSGGAAASELGLAWLVETNNSDSQGARDLVWADDQIVFASFSETFGAGGTGARLERRYHENGAWFSGHTFGGSADEDVHAVTRDHAGRILLGGWTESYSDGITPAAWLVRIPAGNFQTTYEETTASLSIGTTAVLGLPSLQAQQTLLPSPNPASRSQQVSWSSQENLGWQLFTATGQLVAEGVESELDFRNYPGLRPGVFTLVSASQRASIVLVD